LAAEVVRVVDGKCRLQEIEISQSAEVWQTAMRVLGLLTVHCSYKLRSSSPVVVAAAGGRGRTPVHSFSLAMLAQEGAALEMGRDGM
jgi:hypothetical protein